MNYLTQKTIKNNVSFSGVALHSGLNVNMCVKPAEPNFGIVFKRTDIKNNNLVYPNFLNVSNRVVWDVNFYNDKVYVSTSNGIVECNFTIIDNQFKIYENKLMFKNSEIYDFKIKNDELFVSSSEGLFNYNLNTNELSLKMLGRSSALRKRKHTDQHTAGKGALRPPA